MLALNTIPLRIIGNTCIAYIHYISMMICFSSLIVGRTLIKANLNKYEVFLIIIADIIYGLSSLLILISGILRVLYFGRDSTFYTENPLFWWKVGVYLAIGGLSLYPTVTYILWIIPLRRGELPIISKQVIDRLCLILNIELLAFILVPLLATLLTQGIGLPM
uniref:DUF2214 family protein n=1 Tax=Paulinella longichromatophora TaxID=1708747 RepID=A0A2H4ZND5_9EUKA|nr:hypothetical protein PLO_011 [Paulinella longichromatophora]